LAKADCAHVFDAAKACGFSRLVLAGKSDLAEIAILCALDAGVTIVALVDPLSDDAQFVGVDAVRSYAHVREKFDAVMVTDVTRARPSFEAAIAACGADRVLAPKLLGLRPPGKPEDAA
jgi:hypothetical protein